MSSLINPNPVIYEQQSVERSQETEDDEDVVEDIDSLEIFELLRNINDPEHPHSLEQLKVIQYNDIQVQNDPCVVDVKFTPTIPHCSMATLIGLSLRVKLLRSLPARYKVDISIAPGTHQSEHAVNKQLRDKERVAAALENKHLLSVVNKCLAAS
eukprot:gb/GECH01011717.1/.p1 GENE.gb/GECH01011717.1/~~gb/GECH01011717.1/.p1  ORF type:complete len:155 (+),score=27.25 gb/GECH01011717.1/:1-465(+)